MNEEGSDTDRRGIYLPPARMHWSLYGVPEQIEQKETEECYWELQKFITLGLSHDIKKFFGLLLKKNGYVLEQLYSPLIIATTPEHEELKTIAKGCITKFHAHHYLGFAETQWKLFEKERPRRIKPLLYVYRVFLTGIHLMRTGVVEANLLHLNEQFKLPYINELVRRKSAGPEQSICEDADLPFHRAEYERLQAMLERASVESPLPEEPSTREALNDLLIRIRMGQVAG